MKIKRGHNKRKVDGYYLEAHKQVGSWSFKGLMKLLILIILANTLSKHIFDPVSFFFRTGAHIITFWIMNSIKHPIVYYLQAWQVAVARADIRENKPKHGKKIGYFWDIEYAVIYYQTEERPEEYTKIFE